MLSRIFWIGIAGLALVVGMVLQDGDRSMFSWDDNDRREEVSVEREVSAAVDRAVERSFEKMEVTGPDGEEIAVPAETKQALANAVGELVKAKTELAFLRARDASDGEVRAAEARSDRASAEVERLKAEIKRLEQAPGADADAVSAQIQQEVRDEVRTAVREAVRN